MVSASCFLSLLWSIFVSGLRSCSLTAPLLEENISGVPCWKGIRQDRLVGVNSQKVKKAIVLYSQWLSLLQILWRVSDWIKFYTWTQRWGGLDILVSNAAVNPYFGPTLGCPEEVQVDKLFINDCFCKIFLEDLYCVFLDVGKDIWSQCESILSPLQGEKKIQGNKNNIYLK